MKKVISILMALAILALTAVAFAEENTQENVVNGMTPPGQTQGGPMKGGPGGQPPMGQPPTGEKPEGAPELPSGEKPADAPELPSGERPADAPELPSGEKPADVPELPTGEKPADALELPAGEKPMMIDFDAMVTKGVISQETCDKIKTYMEEHKPADVSETGREKPAEDQTPPEKPTEGQTQPEKPADAPGMEGGLLADLLKDGIITQAEYDALIAAQTSAAV